MLDNEFIQQDARTIIEDTFDHLLFTLEDFLDTIRDQHPTEDEFATQQLEKLCQNIGTLTRSRVHHVWEATEVSGESLHLTYDREAHLDVSLGIPDSSRPGLDQHQMSALVNTQHLLTPCFGSPILHDFEEEISILPSVISNNSLAETWGVQRSIADQVSHSACVTSPANDLEMRPTRSCMISRSLHTRITSIQGVEEATAKLDRLTFLITNGDYLRQLRTNILTLRSSASLGFSDENEDVAQILEQLEETKGTYAFKCRLLLFCLVRIRDKTAWQVKLKRVLGILPERGARKVEDQVLDILVERLHQAAKRDKRSLSLRSWRRQFKAERKKIKNAFLAARIWCTLAEEFGVGILLLVPWSGRSGSLNHRYQSTLKTDQKMLCHLMRQQEDGIIQEAAEVLTPFVESILKGCQPPRLRIESKAVIPANIDRLAVISLLQDHQ